MMCRSWRRRASEESSFLAAFLTFGQPAACHTEAFGDTDGFRCFISIDCGYITKPSYQDQKTGITYVSDEGFADEGTIHTVNRENLQPDLADRYFTLRSFPDGTRNCYTLRSLPSSGKYYVRAIFGYGNYDSLNRLPTFDLYLGVNYWTTVSIINATTAYIFETVGFGPNRYHFGTDYHHIRYPDDRYDRIWQRYEAVSTWTILPGTTPVNDSRMDLWWSSDSSMKVDIYTKYFVVLYCVELEILQGNEFRQFDILLDNSTLVSAFTLHVNICFYGHCARLRSSWHFPCGKIKLQASFDQRIGDILASAMLTIQTKLSVKRNWEGDPCSPRAFAWDGLNCTNSPSGPPRIIALYLSSSGLIGEIDPSFDLDLSHNNLSGSIPDFLGQLPSLTFLDLSSNNLSGPIPTLLQKSKDGLLTLRIDNNQNICANGTCDPNTNQKKSIAKKIIVPSVVGGIILLALLVAVCIFYKRIERLWTKAPQLVRDNQDSQSMRNGQSPQLGE
ncbi:hypothetical protein ACP4OV_002111 [Aristida adscensionis]